MAAADAAEDKGPPPVELEYAWQSREYPGALPRAGGFRDQPVALMKRMRATLNVWSAFMEFIESGISPQWTLKNHDKYEMIVMITRMREKRNAENATD